MNKHSFYEKKRLNTKWKVQSDQFRSAVASSNNGGATEMVIDDRITCQFCNRKFIESAAAKHIPVCEKNFLDSQFKKKNQKAAEKARKY